MLDLHELQVFLVAAETENFSEAGRRLQISQPAVSAHIQALEQHLDTRLFDRIGRNIKLNEMGEAFVPVVRNLLKEAQQAEQFVAARQGSLTGSVTLGCSTASGKYILPRIMARFLQQYPEVRTLCHVGPREMALDQLTNGEVDLAVSSLRVPRSGIEYRHFADDLIILVAPPDHPWASRDHISLEMLLECPIILREARSGTVITLNRELAAHDMSVEMLQVQVVLCNTESIVQAVIEGIGPAFVSQLAAEWGLQQGKLIEVPVEGLHLIQKLYMARHTEFHATETQTCFWDFTFAPENRDLRPVFNKES
ncbi:MAG: LysR family transcriptional regulator [Chloroflexi bacterium]|nr:LysR family transcriptional regulator [Chloroflexota bacterium]